MKSTQDNRTDQWRSYSHLATEYDGRRFLGADGVFLFETDARIVRTLHKRTGAAKTIDVPVGTGRVLRYLPECHILGVDLTPEMLAEARKVANSACHQLKLGNAAELPVEDGEFGCLISLRFFHLFPREERAQFAREFARAVKPGGYLIVSFTNGWYGGGIGWLRRVIGRKTVYFEYPGEVRTLFPGFRVICRVGNYLPKQRLLEKVPGFRKLLHIATATVPLNLFCGERYYLLQKPDLPHGFIAQV